MSRTYNKIYSKGVHKIKNAGPVRATGTATVIAHGKTLVHADGNARVFAGPRVEVYAYDDAFVEADDLAKVVIVGNPKVIQGGKKTDVSPRSHQRNSRRGGLVSQGSSKSVIVPIAKLPAGANHDLGDGRKNAGGKSGSRLARVRDTRRKTQALSSL